MSAFPPNIVQLQEEPVAGTVIVADPPQEFTITVAERGPKGDTGSVGPTGPQGPAGVAGVTGLNFVQSNPATPWVFTHNLGYIPLVQVFDDGGEQVDVYMIVTSNTVTIMPGAAATGTVRVI